jgi:hypothetical protein
MIAVDHHDGVVIMTTQRWLQQATGVGTGGTGTSSEWFSWLLASVLGIVGVAASVVLVYVITLICDKGGRWFFPPYYNNENGVAVTRMGTAAAPTQQQQYLGLDRNRLDIEDRKQIVKELFAKEIFLYGAASSSTSVTTVATGSAEDDGAEAGIQLQTLTTQETSESDDTPKKVQQKEAVQPATDDAAALEGDGINGVDKDKDLETGILKQEGPAEDTLGNAGQQEGASPEAFSGNECCICLAPYVEADVVLRSKHCPHMFHAACGENWMLLKPVCPLCTTPMILDAEWEATAISVLGQERYDALLAEQREGREPPPIVSSA